MTVYIKDAHPSDEWQMGSNVREDVCYVQPKTTPQRLTIANDFVERFSYPIPMLVDPIENRADDAYCGWPERLVVVDERGRIALKGGTGPFHFDPAELEQWLVARFGPAKPAPGA